MYQVGLGVGLGILGIALYKLARRIEKPVDVVALACMVGVAVIAISELI